MASKDCAGAGVKSNQKAASIRLSDFASQKAASIRVSDFASQKAAVHTCVRFCAH
jgi:hypothetical protein